MIPSTEEVKRVLTDEINRRMSELEKQEDQAMFRIFDALRTVLWTSDLAVRIVAHLEAK